jgi:UDP-N-acetylmuramoylalanine--D-glutamate ligase
VTVSLADIEGRTVDLLGAGIDNTALLPHLRNASAIRVWVDDVQTIDESTRSVCTGANASIGEIADWIPGDLIVRSPGFPFYRADIASVLSTVADELVTTAVNLWLETFGDRYPTVIVTGTKGKSTVARMLASILPGSVLVGNIGTPIWSLDPPPEGSPVVCEISSYQAVNMTHRANLGVLTSLGEDHVSWHGSVERYHRDKLTPLLEAERVVTTAPLLPVVEAHHRVRTPPERRHPQLDHMPDHVAINALLAITAAEWLQQDFDVTVADDPALIISRLPPMVGRLRELDGADHHRWFDDSLASNPSGTAAAVTAFADDDLWLILGGIDRRVSPQPLIGALQARSQTVSIVGIPENGDGLIDQITAAGIELDQQLSAPDVATAVSMIRSHVVRPSTVLFSPAAPTPHRHGNWSNRSAAFEEAVLDQGFDPG